MRVIFMRNILMLVLFAPDYPESQSEKIGIKAEYFQFKIRNNILNRGFTMLAAMITFSKNKLVK